MNKELIIRSSSNIVDFALLKDGKLVEFQKDKESSKYSVGDIFIAKVRKSIPGLNAAFVNVGYHKDGFLHYHDLGPKLPTYLKFIKGIISGKLKNYSIENFTFEKETFIFLFPIPFLTLFNGQTPRALMPIGIKFMATESLINP